MKGNIWSNSHWIKIFETNKEYWEFKLEEIQDIIEKAKDRLTEVG
jgi:hypothetical protein